MFCKNGNTTISSGQPTTLSASGGNEGSGCTYQWGTGNCGNNQISGSSFSIIVSPTSTTTYWVRRIGTSTCSNTTDCASVTVTVTVGIDEVTTDEIVIYPNPTQSEIFIKSELRIEKVEIYSIVGALLQIERNVSEKISISTLPYGVYFIKVFTEKGIVTSKIVKE
jgi:hypothetical protein